MRSKVYYYFKTAQYSQIIRKEKTLKAFERKYFLAALVFLGDIEKAEVVFNRTKWAKKDLVEVHFYWLLGSIRTQNYESMSLAYIHLYKKYHGKQDQIGRFYVFQALALVRFYQGHMASSCYFASRAYKIAVDLKEDYLCMISTDLAGHAYSRRRAYARGEHYFQLSLNYADLITKNLNSRVINLALLSYRVEAGKDLTRRMEELTNWQNEIATEDFYSSTNALLLRVEIYIYEGNLLKAKQELLNAAQIVFKHAHKRQIFEYNLRLIQIHKIQGERDSALNLLQTTLKLCEKNNDDYYLYRFTMLEAELDRKNNIERNNQIEYLSRKIGLQNNEGQLLFWENKFKQEEINPSTLIALEEEKLLGALYLNNLYPSKTFLDFSYGRKYLLISNGQQIKLIRTLTVGQLNLIEVLCSRSRWSKKELYEKYWGGTYDSFIHDNKIYVTLKRLERKLNFSPAIFVLKRGSIEVLDLEIHGKNDLQELEASQNSLSLLREGFNFRQAKFIEEFSEKSIIKPSEYAQRFQISRNTATRDLRHLVAKKVIQKYGSHRGTFYIKSVTS